MNSVARRWTFFLTLGITVAAAAVLMSAASNKPPTPTAAISASKAAASAKASGPIATATFGGGCFWSTESAFEGKPGVIQAVSGFSGGKVANPSYEAVCTGATGHAEAVQVTYDPKVTSYQKLLDIYWHSIDPTQANGQFYDHGVQYRTVIFYGSDAERRMAESSKEAAARQLKQKIVTTIQPYSSFYPAEEYHQDYSMKNPERYGAYRSASGRDARLEKLWGKSAAAAHH